MFSLLVLGFGIVPKQRRKSLCKYCGNGLPISRVDYQRGKLSPCFLPASKELSCPPVMEHTTMWHTKCGHYVPVLPSLHDSVECVCLQISLPVVFFVQKIV